MIGASDRAGKILQKTLTQKRGDAHGRHIAFQDMEISPADRRLGDF